MKDVFTVIRKEEWNQDVWRKVGAAFENKDGSLTIFLDAVPLNGKLLVRERKAKEASQISQGPREET